MLLRQLKSDTDGCCRVDCLPISGRGPETDLFRHAASLFVQAVSEAAYQALHHDLSGSGKGDFKHYVALDSQLAGFLRQARCKPMNSTS